MKRTPKPFRCSWRGCGQRFAAAHELARHVHSLKHSERSRARAKARRAERASPQQESTHDDHRPASVGREAATLDRHASYAYGRVEGWLYAYAESLGIAGNVLAGLVGEALRDAARGRARGA